MKTGRAYFRLILTLSFCFVCLMPAYGQDKDEMLNSLIEEALRANPRIQAYYNDWKKSEFKITSESSLPDPMASYTYFGENVETRVGPQESKYGLSQKIPFPGKLGIKARAQRKEAEK